MGSLPGSRFTAAVCLALLVAGTAAAASPYQPGAGVSADLYRLLEQIEQQPGLRTSAQKVIIEAPASYYIAPLLQLPTAEPTYTRGRLTQISVTGDQLPGLLQSLPQGVIARLSYPHQPSEVLSEGTALIGAIDFHALGIDGTGIKIGIIDTGFAGLSSSQAAGELPAGQTFTDYTVFPPVPASDDTGSDHGTNIAEIVHDTAPGAELFLAKISTDLELAAAVDGMIAAGVNIIHQPLVWFGAAFYDGTGPLCDIADSAEAANILWTNPAGNLRLSHYLGVFSDADSDLRHEFATDQNYNTVALTAGIPLSLTLNWDAYQSPAPADYDLFLYHGDPDAGGVLVASSQNMQSGGFALPYETIDYMPAVSGTFHIVVGKQSGATPDLPLTLFSFSHTFGVSVTASSIAQPADCASVLTVGATALDDTPGLTSSEGPTTDGRNKPDIAGPTGVSTSRAAMFGGTSASSSYVAGAAALVSAQKAFCASSINAIRAVLLDSTEDLGTPGVDPRTGHGRISLDADGDGFTHDSDNCARLHNPDQLDSDGDQFGNACDTDDDNDGLSDAEEAQLGTDPLTSDTDTDGLTDGDENGIHGTDPLLLDTDNDGAGDGLEIAAGTNALDIASFPVLSDGDLNDDGNVDVRDVLIAYRALMGDLVLSPFQTARGDVAPLISGIPAPDGEFNPGDALLIQRKALGLVSF